MPIDLPALRSFVELGVSDGTRTARFHLVVLMQADAFQRMNGDERKKAAADLFGRESYATEMNKMFALSRQLAREGGVLRRR